MSTTRKPKIEPYVSPFILQAKKQAEERAAKVKKFLKPKLNLPVQNDWDENVVTPGLFDPKLKKQEIFRISKEDVQKKSRATPTEKPHGSITMKTHDVSPRRTPTSPSYRRMRECEIHTPLNMSITESMEKAISAYPATPNKTIATASTTPRTPQPKALSSSNPTPNRGPTDASNSPINATVAETILEECEKRPEDTFTLQLHPDHILNNPQSTDDVTKPKAGTHDTHYNDLIKERLRMMLQKNRAGYQTKRQNYQDQMEQIQSQAQESQQYARDMMQSMATIMKVVGEIVTGTQQQQQQQQQQQLAGKEKQRMKRKIGKMVSTGEGAQLLQQAYSSVGYYPHATPYTTTTPLPQHPNYYSNYPPNYPTITTTMTGSDPNATVNTAVPHYTIPPPSSSQQQPYVATGQTIVPNAKITAPLPPMPIITTYPNQQTVAIQHPPEKPITLPRSKSAALDLIMAKLQGIESCEHDIHAYLCNPDQHAPHKEEEKRRNKSQQQATTGKKSTTKQQQDPESIKSSSSKGKQKKTAAGCDSDEKGGSVTRMKLTRQLLHQHDEQTTTTQSSSSSSMSRHPSELARFPALKDFSHDTKDELEEYMSELARVRALKEVPFVKHHSTRAISGDTVSAILFDRMLNEVCNNDMELIFEDIANSFVNTI